MQDRAYNNRQYDFVLPDTIFNMEQHEASVEQHYARIQRERIDAAVQEFVNSNGVAKRIKPCSMNVSASFERVLSATTPTPTSTIFSSA